MSIKKVAYNYNIFNGEVGKITFNASFDGFFISIVLSPMGTYKNLD